jgi:hypothetical protein
MILSGNGLRACLALSWLRIGHRGLGPPSRWRLKVNCLPNGWPGSAGGSLVFGLQRLAETLFPGARQRLDDAAAPRAEVPCLIRYLATRSPESKLSLYLTPRDAGFARVSFDGCV